MLNRECLACHAGPAAPGGLSFESAARLRAGGRHGPPFTPGKGAESLLVRYLTGVTQPQMPPGKPLSLETIGVMRRWIDEGAVVDTFRAPGETGGILRGALPQSTPRRSPVAGVRSARRASLPSPVRQSAPATALALAPDGKQLAVGGYRAVRLLDSNTGTVADTLSGPADQVLGLAWSPDGKHLAAAGGISGVGGEVCLWERTATGQWAASRHLQEHSDSIQAIAWRTDHRQFATAALDRTVRLWDADTGKVLRTLTDHVDAVWGVAYSVDGRWFASASGDRTAKLYDAATGRKVASLAHAEAVTALAFSPKGDLLVTAAADRQVRVWPVREGPIENPLRSRSEEEPVNTLAFSPDGAVFAWGASNRQVRLWSGDVQQQTRELRDAEDWLYAVTLSPTHVFAAGADGRVYCWETATGRLRWKN